MTTPEMNNLLEKYVVPDDADDTEWFTLVDLQVKTGERCRFARLDLERNGFYVATTVDEVNWKYLLPFVAIFDRGEEVQLPVFKGRNGKWMFSQVTAARMLHNEIPAAAIAEVVERVAEREPIRTQRVQTYVTPDERLALEQVAASQGIELHQMVRNILLGLLESK